MTAAGINSKRGGGFESLWTANVLLDLLEREADWIYFEPPAPGGRGAEFVLHKDGVNEWHEVKWRAGEDDWTIGRLSSIVLTPFWDKVAVGDCCVFVSNKSAPQLEKLLNTAKTTHAFDAFEALLHEQSSLDKSFGDLCKVWPADPRQAHHAL